MRGALAKAGSQWYVLKLSSMSTIMREWAAIHCLAHMPLRDVLLSAKVRTRERRASRTGAGCLGAGRRVGAASSCRAAALQWVLVGMAARSEGH